MANYANLITAIDAVIKANGQQEITGDILNDVLTAMVESLGANYHLKGVATPSTDPNTPDQNIFYFATEGGTYTNFNEAVVPTGLSILLWNGVWRVVTFYEVDDAPTDSSTKFVKSGGVYAAIQSAVDNIMELVPDAASVSNKLVDNSDMTEKLAGKQNTLTFDNTPTEESSNPVKSGGVYSAIQAVVQDIMSLIPNTASEANKLVDNNDLTNKLSQKQDNLTFDDSPTENSSNPVKSGGVYTAIDNEKVRAEAAEKANADDIDDIEGKIPSQASASNQLADKDFVNSSVATNTANYISDEGQPFTSLQDLQDYSGTLTNNDYAFVVGTDAAGNTQYTRYKYNASTSTWAEEYVLNNSSFTAEQWAAISSGITSSDKIKLDALPTNTELVELLNGKQNTLTFDDSPTAGSSNPVKSGGVKTALDGKQDSLTFDDVPTENSNNPVKSGGVYSGIKAEETRAKAAEEANAKDISMILGMLNCAGIMWRLSDTQKTIEYFGPTSIKNAIMDYIDNSPLPCEVKKDGTDFAYLTNTAGVASSTNWQTRVDGTASKYATADKDYLQMVELKNINVRFVTDEASDIALVAFNLDTECPEGFHRLCKESTKLYARYDLTFNSDGTTLDSCNGTSQSSGNFSFDNVFSMTRATNTDLLNWTGWEIAVFGWLEAFRYNTFDLQSSDLGSGLSDGSDSSARNWVNGTTDALTTPHGASGGGFRFMYMENCNYGKQWLMGFGVRGDLAVGRFTYDEDKANAAVILATDDADETFVISTTSGTYAKNVNALGVLTESGGSSSTGFCDGYWSNIGATSRILYCGGTSDYGVFVGPFARHLTIDVSTATWYLRGRCAIKRSKVASA